VSLCDVRESVHASQTLLTHILKSIGSIYSSGAFWGKDKRFKLCGQKVQKFKVTMVSNIMEMHFLALLMQCLENCSTAFHQTFSVDAFWDKDERSILGSKDKVTP